MSFILDAIAKSERERQQQEIPDARILATPVSDSQRPRRNLPYFVAGALLLGVILLLIWMQSDPSPFNRFSPSNYGAIEPSATQIATPDNEDLEDETSNVAISHSSAPLKPVVETTHATTQTAGAKISIPDPVPLTRKPTALDQSSADTKDRSPTLIEDTRGALEVKLESTPSATLAKTRQGNSNKSVVTEPNTQTGIITPAQHANQTGVENIKEPAPRRITRLSELPANVRRDLPSVTFTGHLFSKNVNLSYVMVDGGRSVIAGQQIVDELFLHAVTPTGAIVDFRGFLIETGILQNWSLK